MAEKNHACFRGYTFPKSFHKIFMRGDRQRYRLLDVFRGALFTDVLPGAVHRAVFMIGRQYLIPRAEVKITDNHVDGSGWVWKLDDIICLAAKVSSQLGAGF